MKRKSSWSSKARVSKEGLTICRKSWNKERRCALRSRLGWSNWSRMSANIIIPRSRKRAE